MQNHCYLRCDVVVDLAGAQQVVLHDGTLEHGAAVRRLGLLVRLERLGECLHLLPGSADATAKCQSTVYPVDECVTCYDPHALPHDTCQMPSRLSHPDKQPTSPAQDALQVHLLEEGVLWQGSAALIFVQGAQHARALGPSGSQDGTRDGRV